MEITRDQLKQISPNTPDNRIDTFIPHLNAYMPQYGIDTPNEVASFLAQVLHESGGLKWLREIWGPTSAQTKYEGRDDLGNNVKGDGKKFMGRGLIQLTGRANYTKMSKDMFGDDRLIHAPDLLSTAEYAVKSACIYWQWRKMDLIDDDMDIRAETRAVNGGSNGLIDRQKYFDRAISVLQS
jgi:putative chitinase